MSFPPPITALSQQELLDLLDRILPESYLTPLQAGMGYEILRAYASVWAAISQSAQEVGSDAQVATAGDGAYSTGNVQLYRTSLPQVGEQIPGQAGTAASIVTGAPSGQMRVTGLANITAADIGRYIQASNTYAEGNTGGFRIISAVDASTCDVINASATVPDANNGSIAWYEEDRTVTVKAGTVVGASVGGQDFGTVSDVVFSSTAYGPISVGVRSVAIGYEFNVPGQVVTAAGVTLPGAIDTMKVLIENPPLLDTSIRVLQITATSGGADGTLNTLGADRGIDRQLNEAVASYRARVRALPNTVTPVAITAAVRDILRPYNVEWEIIETFDVAYQTCFDSPSGDIPGAGFNASLFAYDDDRLNTFHGRWMDTNDYRGGVIVVVGSMQPIADLGMAYDDTAPDAPSLASAFPGGSRAVCAYDMPNSYLLSLQGAYDGDDYARNATYLALYATLQAIKAAGVSVAVELKGVN